MLASTRNLYQEGKKENRSGANHFLCIKCRDDKGEKVFVVITDENYQKRGFLSYPVSI